MWSYVLISVEKKYVHKKKELAILAKNRGAIKELAKGQPVKVETYSAVHCYLRKGTVGSTKATNTR